MSAPELAYVDVQQVLAQLGDLGATLVLVGGQALNVWAETYVKEEPALSRQAPFTSKDIDFQGDHQAARVCADRLNGTSYLGTLDDHSVNTGVVVYVDHRGDKRKIDFIESPLGLKADEVRRLAIPFDVLDPNGQPTGTRFLVLHPVHCLESRVYNTTVLPDHDRPKDLAQLRASILVARHFLKHLLVQGLTRDVHRLNERIFCFCLNNLRGREVVARFGIDPFEAVLVDDRLGKFVTERYPRMRDQLQAMRARRAATPRSSAPQSASGPASTTSDANANDKALVPNTEKTGPSH